MKAHVLITAAVPSLAAPPPTGDTPACGSCEEAVRVLLRLDVSGHAELFATTPDRATLWLGCCTNQDCDEYGEMNDETAESSVAWLAPPREGSGPQLGELDGRELRYGAVIEDAEAEPSTEDKLGGFPAWVQEDGSPPRCPRCRTKRSMRLRLQLSMPELSAAFEIPEGAVVFVFQCEVHPQVLVPVWQCS
jgi:hypothetical protein